MRPKTSHQLSLDRQLQPILPAWAALPPSSRDEVHGLLVRMILEHVLPSRAVAAADAASGAGGDDE